MHYSILLSVAALTGLSSATYTLRDDYGTGFDFFNKFTFFSGPDPSGGYVDYVNQSTAIRAGLIRDEGRATYIGVDHTNVATGFGRQSVRLTSTATYNGGLFILDLAHMPGSQCGSWPAFWTTDHTAWPVNGEIDIIEGVDATSLNSMTLHTNNGCSVKNNTGFSGYLSTSNCSISAGCSIHSKSRSSYGTGFNRGGGGVYAMEWTDSFIRVFSWLTADVPADITFGFPDPNTWGEPAALFEGDCNISEHFANHTITLNIDFCGFWGNSVWPTDSCASKASTCEDYVQNTPSAFVDTYWVINSLKVYERQEGWFL